MEKFMQTLNEYLVAAKGVIVTYAPQVWEATLTLVRMTCIFYLILGGLMLLVGVIGGKKLFEAIKEYPEVQYRNEGPVIWKGVVGAGVALLGLIGGLVNLLNVYNWLGAISPQLAIIYRVAEKAGLL